MKARTLLTFLLAVMCVFCMAPQAEAATGREIADKAMEVENRYVPYVYGGTSLSGMDCGGLLYYVGRECGIDLPKQQYNQRSYGMGVDHTAVKNGNYSNLQPGDLLFFSFYGRGSDHAGIYVGDGYMVHMSSGSSDSRKVTLTAANGRGGTWLSSLITVRRVANGRAFDLAYCEHPLFDTDPCLSTYEHPHIVTYTCRHCGMEWLGMEQISETCGICFPAQYEVTFDAEGGRVKEEDRTVDFGYIYGELPEPTRDEDIFMGWYTEEEGGRKITASDFVELSEDATLYARWADPEVAGLDNFVRTACYEDTCFTDVKQDWYTENITAAYEFGLMTGEKVDYFDISGEVTVAEAVAMSCRLYTTYYGIDADFSFVPNPEWYKVFVAFAEDNGILREGEFEDFEAPVTRKEFASLLAHAFPDAALEEVNEVEDRSIPDVEEHDPHAADIYRLYRAGILTGSPMGLFGGSEKVIRTEAAAVITRMADEGLRMHMAPKYAPVPEMPVVEETAEE